MILQGPMVSPIKYDSQIISQNQKSIMETIVKTRRTTKNNPNHYKSQETKKKKNTIFKLSRKTKNSWFSWFLQWFWWSGARNHCKNQEKPPKTTTNHQNHRKNQETPKKHRFQSISPNRILVFFLRVYSGFGSQRARNHPKKPRKNTKNHDKPPKPPQKPRKTTKNHDKPPNHRKNQEKPEKNTNYLSKSSIRGFSWFLQWFWWSRTRNHRKNQEKPRILDFERWFLKWCFFWLFLVFAVVLVVCRGFWWFFLVFAVVSSS